MYPGGGTPNLEYYDHSIDDDNNGDSEGDGDGYVEPGETIELKVKLKNTGDAEANNVYAILSTTTSWITITDNYAGYGNIPAGSIKECNDEYVFHVGNPGGKLAEVIYVRFDLDIHSNEGTWSDYFYIPMYPGGGTPNLEYYDHEIDDDNYGESSGDGDGKAEEGETIEMPVWLKNTGNEDAHNVYAYISTSSSYITITDDYETYPDIPAGSTKVCNDDFGFYVNTGLGSLDGILYVKIDIEIHSSEGTWNDYFYVAIYP
jgi:hypothetical protein